MRKVLMEGYLKNFFKKTALVKYLFLPLIWNVVDSHHVR